MNEEVQQKSDWRARLMADVLSNTHDEETRAELLIAGLEQAHTEGVEDATFICDGIAHQSVEPRTIKVATTIAKALRDYNARNKNGRSHAGQSTRTEET